MAIDLIIDGCSELRFGAITINGSSELGFGWDHYKKYIKNFGLFISLGRYNCSTEPCWCSGGNGLVRSRELVACGVENWLLV